MNNILIMTYNFICRKSYGVHVFKDAFSAFGKLQARLIQPSNSSWSASVILVRTKDESTRLNNSRLNSVTRKDSYQIPRVDDALAGLACAKYLITLNLSCVSIN